MKRGRGKVEFEDLRVGAGATATREHEAKINCRITLHRGESVRDLTDLWVDLKRRSTIAGVRYGIEGMCVGGVRRIIVPPQLAYGSEGMPGASIPPNAMLICEVELLDLKPSRPTTRD